jgi:hypothetical protein
MTTPPISGYVGWYKGDGWSSSGWTNASNPGTNNVTTFTSNNIFSSYDSQTGYNYVYGGITSSITFPFTWSSGSQYTFFHVARYNGVNKQRIFTGKNVNWLSGYHNDGNLSVGVALHNEWLTPVLNPKFDHRMWMVAADRPTNFRGNSIDQTTIVIPAFAPNQIIINGGLYPNEVSDWAISEIIIYNSTLSDNEVKSIENYLMTKYLNSVPDTNISMDNILNSLNGTTINTIIPFSSLYRDNGIITTNITSVPIYGNGSINLSSIKNLYRTPLLFRLSANNINASIGTTITTWKDELNKYNTTVSGTTYLQYDSLFKYHYVDFTGINYIVLPTLTLKYRNNLNVQIQGFTAIIVSKFNDVSNWSRLFDFGIGGVNTNLLAARYFLENTFCVQMLNNSSSYVSSFVTANIIDLNLHIWTIVVNNVLLTMSLYMDGVLVNSTTYTDPLVDRVLTTNYLGKSNSAGDSLLNGRIANFDFYTLPLTNIELLALHTHNLKKYACALPLMPGLMYRIFTGYFADVPSFFTTNTETNTGTTNIINNIYNGTESLKEVNSSNFYSVEWFGYFRATITGIWKFYIASSDASYMWLGVTALSGYTTTNALLINPGTHGLVEVTNTITLTTGQYYPIRIQYGRSTQGSDCQFSFIPPGGTRTYDGTGYYFTGTGFSSLYPALSVKSLKVITNVNLNSNFWILVNGISTSTIIPIPTSGTLQLKLDASTLSDGGVTSWNDQSTNAWTFTSINTAPIKVAVASNGYPGVNFIGTGYLSNGIYTPSFTTNNTIFFVVSNITGGCILYKGKNTLSWSGGEKLFWMGNGTVDSSLKGRFTSFVGYACGYYRANSAISASGTTVVCISTTSSSTMQVYYNGIQIAGTSGDSGGGELLRLNIADPGNTLAIGGTINTSPNSQGIVGCVHQILHYNAALSSTDIAAINKSLIAKWTM